MSNFRLNLVKKNDVAFEWQRDIKTPQIYKCSVAWWLASRLVLGRNFVGGSVRIPVIAKHRKKVWNSSGVFFVILLIIKY